MLAKAMEDVTILDLSTHLSGPFTTRILSDLGARVIKVEGPEGRTLPPFPGGLFPGFIPPNVGKESIAIDMKSAAGHAVILDLARKADVVVENFRPGVTGRLKVDYDSLRAVNPSLVYCSISGFGSTGPLATKPAFDATIQAMSGIMHATGETDRPPALTTINIGDLAASCMAATAITAALMARARTGEGAYIDMSMLDAALYLLPIQAQFAMQVGYVMGRHGSGYGPNSITGAFQTSDGIFLEVICPTFAFQRRFRDAVAEVEGFGHIATDPRFADPAAIGANNEAFLALARQAFPARDAAAWGAALDAADVPWGPVLTIEEILQHEQVRHRGLIGEVVTSEGGKPLPMVLSPFGGAPATPARVPGYGEQGEEIMAGLLGYSAERRAELRQFGAVLSAAQG
jgi:CoA:oxalate CoA-transferase